MESLGRAIRRKRIASGLTQTALARRADISLATVQNIEAGRGNPSMSTVRRLLREVGMTLEWKEREADWDTLSAHGLPLAPATERKPARSEGSLCAHLLPAMAEVCAARPPGPPRDAGDRERRFEALQALVLALKQHYPSVFARRLARSPLARSFVTDDPSGRVVKLHRTAAAILAEYL